MRGGRGFRRVGPGFRALRRGLMQVGQGLGGLFSESNKMIN